MNLLITGHTSGIGKYIYDYLGGKGLSRSTGFDMTKDTTEIIRYGDGDFVV